MEDGYGLYELYAYSCGFSGQFMDIGIIISRRIWGLNLDCGGFWWIVMDYYGYTLFDLT